MKELPQRKATRLQGFDYSQNGAYFVTICTKDRKNLFWESHANTQIVTWNSVGANCVRPQNLPLSSVGKIVAHQLEKWHSTYDDVYLYAYVIMPNHLHIIINILPRKNGRPQDAPTLSRMIKQFKGSVSKTVGETIWQRSFYDHVIRGKEDFEKIQEYVCGNPYKWQEDSLYVDE